MKKITEQIIAFAALVAIIGAAIAFYNWVEGISKRVYQVTEKVDGYKQTQVDYEKLAEIMIDKYRDQLKGPRGASVSVEDVAERLATTHSKELRGLDGEPGADAPPVSVEEVARELVENYADTFKGPKGEPGAKGEPADALPIDKVAGFIFENYREEIGRDITAISSRRGQFCKSSQELEVCLVDWNGSSNIATVSLDVRNISGADITICRYSRYAIAVSAGGEISKLSSNRKCWAIPKEGTGQLAYVFEFSSPVGDEFDFSLELEKPHSQFYFAKIPSASPKK